jgi:hypothetical protein
MTYAIYETYETLYMQHSKAINETSLMQHMKTIIATWNAFMAWHLMLMLDDAHDQNFSFFLTSRMLQSSPLKEISSQDYRMTKASDWVMKKETCQTH